VPALGLSLFPGPGRGGLSALKAASSPADTTGIMIISDEQVRRALTYLRTPATNEKSSAPCDVPDELVERVRAALRDLPDTRDERVSEAIARLEADPPTPDEVAAKIIGRAISDSLR